jgi:hypothetical protein
MRLAPRKLVVVGTALVLATGVWLGLMLTRKPTVTHKGRTVREWVLRIDQGVGNEKQREEASWAIVQIGRPAVPELEEILAWRPHKWRDNLRPWLMRFYIIKRDELGPKEVINRAAEAAYKLGERSGMDMGALIPHLEYHFTNGMYADSSAARALASAGSRGIAILTNLMFSGSHNVRDQSAWALHHVSKRPEVMAALIRVANTETNAVLRANALGYLPRSGGPTEDLVPLGLRFLRSTNAYDRQQAKWMLSGYQHLEEVRAALAESGP